MHHEWYAHRFADIILNSDYELKQEIEQVIQSNDFGSVQERFDSENVKRRAKGQKEIKGKQSIINSMLREEFASRGWEVEKNG